MRSKLLVVLIGMAVAASACAATGNSDPPKSREERFLTLAREGNESQPFAAFDDEILLEAGIANCADPPFGAMGWAIERFGPTPPGLTGDALTEAFEESGAQVMRALGGQSGLTAFGGAMRYAALLCPQHCDAFFGGSFESESEVSQFCEALEAVGGL